MDRGVETKALNAGRVARKTFEFAGSAVVGMVKMALPILVGGVGGIALQETYPEETAVVLDELRSLIYGPPPVSTDAPDALITEYGDSVQAEFLAAEEPVTTLQTRDDFSSEAVYESYRNAKINHLYVVYGDSIPALNEAKQIMEEHAGHSPYAEYDSCEKDIDRALNNAMMDVRRREG